MLRYGFFDSEITGYDEEGMPKFDRAESSDFLAAFISKIITNGVLADPGDCFQVIASEGMTLKIRPGFGIIQGRFAMDTQESTVTIPTAPTSYKRIDRVVLRANYLNRLCEIVVKTGTPDANPVPPDLLQPTSGDYYELGLALVAVNSNQSVITQSAITDTRYDDSVCGVVTQAIDHLDTSVFFAQLNQFYEEFVSKSDTSYQDFLDDMQAYLDNLSTSGNNQLKSIVQVLTEFEKESEAQFNSWFQNVKDQLSEDVAGNLQNQLDDHEERITRLEGMIHTGEVSSYLFTDGGEKLLTDDGIPFEAVWYLANK